MREIKFRAWFVCTKEMVYNYVALHCDFSEFIPMQYTGLKDKNGKEIYEGDRVRYETGNSDGQFIAENVTYNGGAFYPVCTQPGKTFEIIGNICENPEFVEKI